jgi:hypothetical protein
MMLLVMMLAGETMDERSDSWFRDASLPITNRTVPKTISPSEMYLLDDWKIEVHVESHEDRNTFLDHIVFSVLLPKSARPGLNM